LEKEGDNMKKWYVLLFSFALILSGCGGGDDESTDQPATDRDDAGGTVDVAAAEEIYKNSACIGCHGAQLGGGAGPSLEQIGSRKSKEEILTVIHEGQGSMAGGLLKGEDAEIVAAWLATMK
jgi:cytochrome c551